jgi:hypothetical protein
MRSLLMVFTLILGFTAVTQADPGRSLANPSDTLQENDCVFKNKGVIPLKDYEFIVDKCDRRYTPQLMIIADHLPQGGCVYDLVQKMSGHTLAKVVSKCPSAEIKHDIQGIIPDAQLEQIEEQDHMPPVPGETPVKKAPAKKAKPPQQEEPVDKPAAPKKKEDVKPKTNEQVEKGNEGYYINPDEIEF